MLWAIVILAHFDEVRNVQGTEVSWWWTAIAISGIFFARSIYIIVGVLVMQIFLAWQDMPDISNHWFLMFFISLTLLCSFLMETVANRFKVNPLNEKWFEGVGSVVRLYTILLYVFAFFHKLNYDYLNPALSCAIITNSSHLHTPFSSQTFPGFIYSSLFLELLMPILLLQKRYWFWGIFLGAMLHLFMGLIMRTFPTLMFVLYFLFIPKEVQKYLIDQFEKILRKITFKKMGLVIVLQIQALGWLIWSIYNFQKGWTFYAPQRFYYF